VSVFVAGGYGQVPGYGGHASDAFGGPNMGGPQQYRGGMNYPSSYPSSSSNIEPYQAGHLPGPGGGGPVPGTSASGDPAMMQLANIGRSGGTTSEDQSLAGRCVQPSDGGAMSTQQTPVGNDVSKDSSVPVSADGNHIRSAGSQPVDDSLSRQQPGLDTRPAYPAGIDGPNLRYGQPGMDVRAGMQKQMFGQMPSRSTPFMNMNGVAIRPGQMPFGPDGVHGRGPEGMGTGPQPNEMDSLPSRPDQPLVGQDGSQRRPGQSMPSENVFGRQGPLPFGMDGPGSRMGPTSAVDQMMRRTGHPMPPDDGSLNRPSQVGVCV